MGMRGRDVYQVKTHIPRWLTPNGRIITIAEFLPDEQGVRASHQVPHRASPALERWTAWAFGFEGQRVLLFRRIRGVWEMETPLLKDSHNSLTHSKTEGRCDNLGGGWVRPTGWSWTPSWRDRRWLELGTETMVAAIWGSLFCHKNTNAGKCNFGILLLAN